ncbi:MAG: RNA-directed DNA polymerase [Saprospiraceae bacterium]|nr:RNA-directed DNA polymerase [Saprospiraceae bacterium]MCB0573034.1 RNA-directed DNA polymerase [Saprospiraceae bacterium]MCB9356539.1 RNA-directed DNA polymerase [Lewinellaceae bacterium]
MYTFSEQKSELNTTQVTALGKRFENLRSVAELAGLLGTTEPLLSRQMARPVYYTFYIPKPGGQKRLIQHPAPALKIVQQSLNRYLQAMYYGVKPDCAYGFILSPSDELRPRNIYSNALAHLKGEWFLLFDLKDFFHTVTLTHLRDLFRNVLFFPPELCNALCQLCAYQGRLPMGAPTSPVLSNLCCLFFDYQLERLAAGAQAVYTRYADDLTFSFRSEPPSGFADEVRMVVLRHGFAVNESKVRLQSRPEQPEITGLVLGKNALPVPGKNWLKSLKQEIKIYTWLMSEAVRERGLFHAWVFDRFRRSVQGQIEFLGFILGKDHREYRKLAGKVRWG